MSLLAHKIEIRPTAEQKAYIDNACGIRRHCWNHLLAYFKQEGVKWSKTSAHAKYKELKLEFSWYGEVSARVARNVIDDLDRAFQNFFRRIKQGGKPGFPTFCRKDEKDRFALRESAKFGVCGRSLRLEKCPGRVVMRQPLRFNGQPRQVTVSRRAGRYYASILVETDDYDVKDTQREAIVGVDLGIKELAVLSDGTRIPANQRLKRSLRSLRRRARTLTKKKAGSNRRAKAKSSLSRLHKRIADQREAILHETSDLITRRFRTIVMEDLAVGNMLKNRKLSRAIADAGFSTLRDMITYKSKLRGNTLIIAPRFFPSSKTCSACGTSNKKLTLSERSWNCACGAHHDRDLNAAVNLRNYGLHALEADLKRTEELRKTSNGSCVDTVNKPMTPGYPGLS